MKPIRLTICGINSYTTAQTIDFESLSETKLFGIFGQTGSGKSTILDCIILSLYGSIDRDNLSSVVNVNVNDAYVQFEFELNQPVATKYRVTRTFKVRQSGLKTGAELVDLTHNINLGDTTEKVNEQLLQMLGIGKKEFLKCIALPQNEFDKFITDTPQERKRSIAKLFDLEDFGDNLNRKVKEKIDLLSIKKATLSEQLNTHADVTPQYINEIKEELKQATKKLETNIKNGERLKALYDKASAQLEKSKQYYAAKYILDDINVQNADYLKLQAELEFFKENKHHIEIFSIMQDKMIQTSNNVEKLQVLTLMVKAQNDIIEGLNNKLNENVDKLEVQKLAYSNFKVQLERVKFINDQIEKNSSKLMQLEHQVDFLQGEYESNFEQAKQYEKLINDSLKIIEKLDAECEELDNIQQKISEFLTLSESEVFANYLTDIKKCFNQTNIDQVIDYRVYQDITKALLKINKYIASFNEKTNQQLLIANDLNISPSQINGLSKKIEGELNNKEQKMLKEQDRLAGLKETALKIEMQSQHILSNINEAKAEIIEVNNELKQLNQSLSYVNVEDNSDAIVAIENVIEGIKGEQIVEVEKLKKFESEINALNVSNGFLNDEIENLNKQLPKNFNPDLANSSITDENYAENYDKLNEFINKKNYYETLIKELESELNGKYVDEDYIIELEEGLENIQNSINELKVETRIKTKLIEINEEILQNNNKANAELKEVTEKLDLILNLQSKLAKNALVDFVAEEYLLLITDYANKFVYKISRGKYLLSYDSKYSEFIAIDNFNGGIKRGIKTLSGGERFIFSLSLALGISQSIAVNNNKNFNFFFIDEGFGNLSEDYLNDVLACFDRLIRMDFTVGFITHVEKMQEFITSKVVVTKPNNEVGSVIKQY